MQQGDSSLRHAPCSTFKIALSLIGFDAEILIDETHPLLPFKEGYVGWMDNWKQPHHPQLWLKNSCIWYSYYITEKLGMALFTDYVQKLNYGNKDTSGDRGKNNGLTNAWLSSSLQISPDEQIIFLEKLLNNALPVSLKAHTMTRNILFLEEFIDGWQLYGKTGSGSQLSPDRTEKLERQIGWFAGWLQKGERTLIFAQYIKDTDKKDSYAGPRARVLAKEKLKQLLSTI